jgi:hypothetical protein
MSDNLLEHLAETMYGSDYNYRREHGSLGIEDCRTYAQIMLAELGLPPDPSLIDTMRYGARILEGISGNNPMADAKHMEWSACRLRNEADFLERSLGQPEHPDAAELHQMTYEPEGGGAWRCSCGMGFLTEADWQNHFTVRTSECCGE